MMDNNLWFLREYNNIKCSKIAKKLDISLSTYSQWENGKIVIPTRRLIDLANFYNVNIDYMLNLSTKMLRIRIKTAADPFVTGARLKEMRTSLGMSLRTLGEKLNYSFSALSSYERGEYLAQSHIITSLSKRTGYSIDWILGRRRYKMIPYNDRSYIFQYVDNKLN